MNRQVKNICVRKFWVLNIDRPPIAMLMEFVFSKSWKIPRSIRVHCGGSGGNRLNERALSREKGRCRECKDAEGPS